MSKLELTYGSDPELVIVNNSLTPCSAIRVLKNDKDHPADLGNGVKFYADNVLAELAFDPVPPDQITAAVGAAITKAKAALCKAGPYGYDLMAQAATDFSLRELRHKTAWMVGCNPNYDAYRFEPNEGGKFTSGLRTGSFHIHIGNAEWKKGKDKRLLSKESKIDAIKLLDLYLGLSSLIWDKDHTSHSRRKLYGKAGEFRPTPYGIEYRVLGNYALRSERLVRLVFDLANLAMGHVNDGSEKDILYAFSEEETISTINNHDVKRAKELMLKLPLPSTVMLEIFRAEEIKSPLALSA
jgi:hypothetical protein